MWSSWFYSIPAHCNQTEAGRNNSLVPCAMNVSIHYCYWKQGTWPRWWQRGKGLLIALENCKIQLNVLLAMHFPNFWQTAEECLHIMSTAKEDLHIRHMQQFRPTFLTRCKKNYEDCCPLVAIKIFRHIQRTRRLSIFQDMFLLIMIRICNFCLRASLQFSLGIIMYKKKPLNQNVNHTPLLSSKMKLYAQ